MRRDECRDRRAATLVATLNLAAACHMEHMVRVCLQRRDGRIGISPDDPILIEAARFVGVDLGKSARAA